MTISAVTLELLRHGPAHGQLLSPLTPYLALCGDGDAASVYFEVEHHRLLKHLRQLRYHDGKPASDGAIDAAAGPISKLLWGIRPFQNALGKAFGAASAPDDLVHVHLVLSASELELLPFELARESENGPFLALRAGPPVVFTRQVRGVASSEVRAKRPRILFVTASRPPGQVIEGALVERHARALVRALDPWLVSSDPKEFGRHLGVVQQATRDKIQVELDRALEEGAPYTHVHVLAHGVENSDAENEEVRYGIALADGDIRGEELARLLAGQADRRPAVVTLATCDSGSQGSVVGPGASAAHYLHRQGVSLVIASQFPLTQDGSVTLTESVYEHLLQGADPRTALRAIRQSLAAKHSHHDWASVVAYASFPEDAPARRERAAQILARSAVEAALARLDRAETTPADRKLAVAKLNEAFTRLAGLLPSEQSDPRDRARAVGLLGVLGSAKKQSAEILWSSQDPGWRKALLDARSHYRRVFRADMTETWAAVQDLAISSAIGESIAPEDWAAHHRLTAQALEVASNSNSTARRIWAHNALIELHVLGQLVPDRQGSARRDASAEMDRLLMLLSNLEQQPHRDAYSLLRQLRRYASWWWKDKPEAALPAELSQRLVNEGVPSTWETLD